MFLFFFSKQKTAYEMRISDRSSDVCSSDLRPCQARCRLRTRTILLCPRPSTIRYVCSPTYWTIFMSQYLSSGSMMIIFMHYHLLTDDSIQRRLRPFFSLALDASLLPASLPHPLLDHPEALYFVPRVQRCS